MTWAQREGDEPWLSNDQIRSSLAGLQTNKRVVCQLMVTTGTASDTGSALFDRFVLCIQSKFNTEHRKESFISDTVHDNLALMFQIDAEDRDRGVPLRRFTSSRSSKINIMNLALCDLTVTKKFKCLKLFCFCLYPRKCIGI